MSVAGGDQRCRVLLVLAVARAAGQPEAVLAPLGGPERSEGEDVPGAHSWPWPSASKTARPGNSSGR